MSRDRRDRALYPNGSGYADDDLRAPENYEDPLSFGGTSGPVGDSYRFNRAERRQHGYSDANFAQRHHHTVAPQPVLKAPEPYYHSVPRDQLRQPPSPYHDQPPALSLGHLSQDPAHLVTPNSAVPFWVLTGFGAIILAAAAHLLIVQNDISTKVGVLEERTSASQHDVEEAEKDLKERIKELADSTTQKLERIEDDVDQIRRRR